MITLVFFLEELSAKALLEIKVSGSRAIGLLLDIHNNRSPRFQVFVSGVKQLTGSES